jgi:TorA maturation chaperone TorD
MSTHMRFSREATDDQIELERAELYGLLSALWLGPPDEALLAQFRSAVTEAPQPGGPLEAAWERLVAQMRATDGAAAAAEYDTLFQGVGKPEVWLYGSYYLSGFLNEQPLARLRTDLAALGLTRDEARGETEDHVAYVFEVMRYLIAGDAAGGDPDPQTQNLEQQRRFFRAHVQPWIGELCDAVQAHPAAHLWTELAAFTRSFVEIEAQGFDLLEA